MYHVVAPSEARLESLEYLLGTYQVEAVRSAGVRFYMHVTSLLCLRVCVYVVATGTDIPLICNKGQIVTGGDFFFIAAVLFRMTSVRGRFAWGFSPGAFRRGLFAGAFDLEPS